RGRVCRTISRPIPSTSSTRAFRAALPTFTFSVTDFASLRRGNTATATFVGTFQRGNGAGASCRGRASRASTPAATSVGTERDAFNFKWGRAEVVGFRLVGWLAPGLICQAIG